MTNLPRSAMSVLLIAVILSLTLAATPSVPVAAPAPRQSQNHQGKKIQTLKNDAAKLRVMQLTGKSKALMRALKDMERIGKSPEWDKSAVFIEESENKTATRKAPSLFGANSFAPQQQTFNDGAGSEMVMITESGPEEYWAGVVYVYDATTGLDSVYSAILTGLVMAQLETMDVIDELYYPPDGSSPIREEPPTNVDSTPYGGGDGGGGGFINPLLELPVAKNNVKGSPTGTVINAEFRRGSPAPFGIIGWFKRYFRCVKRCQALTTMTCFNIFAVPRPAQPGQPPPPYPNYAGFFLCLGFGALASSIICAFNTHACGG